MRIEDHVVFVASLIYLFAIIIDDELEQFIRPYYIGAALAASLIKFA